MDGNIASLAQGQFAYPGLQSSTYAYQVPDGQGALAAYYAANQQLVPQNWLANVFGQGIQPIGAAMGGAYGNPQLGGVLGGLGGQVPNFTPISTAGQILPQAGLPIGGGFGQQSCAIPGSLVGGYATPYPFANQPWFGSLTGQAGQPIGSVFGGPFGIPQIGSALGTFGNQLSGFVPIAVTPQAAQAAQVVAQQAAQVGQQVAHQAAQQVGQQAAIVAQQVAQQAAQQLGQQAAMVACQVAHQMAQQLAQQIAAGSAGQQMYAPTNPLGAQYPTPQPWASQGWFGNLLGQQPRPIGQTTGGIFGYPQLGSALGTMAGQLPWSAVPFSAFPQTANQGGFGGWIGAPSGGFGVLQPGIVGVNPYAGAALGTQTQLAGSPRFSFA